MRGDKHVFTLERDSVATTSDTHGRPVVTTTTRDVRGMFAVLGETERLQAQHFGQEVDAEFVCDRDEDVAYTDRITFDPDKNPDAPPSYAGTYVVASVEGGPLVVRAFLRRSDL